MKNPDQLRLYVFLAVLGFSALGEFLAPRRLLAAPRLWRWAMNLSLMVIDTVVVRLSLPVLALEMAKLAEARGWGLLNHVSLHFYVKLALAFLFLDLVIYIQHWTFHEVPWLWRLHKVHHTDLDLDVSSGVRFHPLEIIVSMLIKLTAVSVIGAHFIAVLLFEAVLNATSLFNHANLRLPARLERFLRLVLVTPDMHRVHHSEIASETNSNFGFNLPWWDRLLGTYDPEPARGHQLMSLGLSEYRDWKPQNLLWLLALPFRQEERRPKPR